MKVLIVVALCVTVALSESVSFKQFSAIPLKDAPAANNRIIEGEPARRGQIPWQVGVQAMMGDYPAWFCGGSIISPDYVLTAAHCVVSPTRFIIWAGGLTTADNDPDRLTIETENAIIHDAYYPSSINNDIALLRLPYALVFTATISAVRLPQSGERIDKGELVQISGWGRTSDDSQYNARELQYVNVTTISNAQCAEVYDPAVIITSTLCAVGNPHHSPCNGDHGGPLVSFDDNGVATHHGVISFVHASGCESGNPSGYVRTESMLYWIAKITGMDV